MVKANKSNAPFSASIRLIQVHGRWKFETDTEPPEASILGAADPNENIGGQTYRFAPNNFDN